MFSRRHHSTDPSRADGAAGGRAGLRRHALAAAVEDRAARGLAEHLRRHHQCIMLSLSMVVIAALVGVPAAVRHEVTAADRHGFEAASPWLRLAVILDRVMRLRRLRVLYGRARIQSRRHPVPRTRAVDGADTMRRALEQLDGGATRMQIAERTGIVGVADVARLNWVNIGADGTLRLRKSTLLRAANGLNTVTRGQGRRRRRERRSDRCGRVRSRTAADRRRGASASRWCSSSLDCCRGARCAERRPRARAARRADGRAATGGRRELVLVGLKEWADALRCSELLRRHASGSRAPSPPKRQRSMDEPFSGLPAIPHQAAG